MAFIAFIKDGHGYCVPEESVGISTSPDSKVRIWSVSSDSHWNDVQNVQVIDCAQNAIAWLGHGVDTEGRDGKENPLTSPPTFWWCVCNYFNSATICTHCGRRRPTSEQLLLNERHQ